MFSIISSSNKTSVGINTYLVDTLAERDTIKTKPGSKAYVIETGLTYILSHSGVWEEYYPALKKYVDDKFSKLDVSPELLEELRVLVDQIENGNIDQLIVNKIEEMNLLTEKDVEEILTEKNYMSYKDEDVIFYGGSATEI